VFMGTGQLWLHGGGRCTGHRRRGRCHTTPSLFALSLSLFVCSSLLIAVVMVMRQAAEGPFAKKKKRKKSGLRRLRKYNLDRCVAAHHRTTITSQHLTRAVCLVRVRHIHTHTHTYTRARAHTHTQSPARGGRGGEGRRRDHHLLHRAGRTLASAASPLLLGLRVSAFPSSASHLFCELPEQSVVRYSLQAASCVVCVVAPTQILCQLHMHQVQGAVLLCAVSSHARGAPLSKVQSLNTQQRNTMRAHAHKEGATSG
jgi:hypothetical protein